MEKQNKGNGTAAAKFLHHALLQSLVVEHMNSQQLFKAFN